MKLTVAYCPQCHAALPSDAPHGLCPNCLLAGVALATDAGSEPSRTPPPALESVAAAFPQLEILELIGRGGMGVVYKARQKSLNRLVALKLLAPERITDPGFADRFAREAQALARLSHPNIVTIHDFGVTPAEPTTKNQEPRTPYYFLLMEFVDGVNLRQAMRAGRFTPEQALAIVPPVCEALQYAHDHGIVHRDIKPENLLLDKNGRVKIADFGIAKMLRDGETPVPATPAELGDKSVPFTLTAAGTPQYMAPEQREHHRTDHRADIYSLGVVLYELLTGELPGAQLQPPSRKVQIDVRLDEVVLRALETKPELRYATAAEFRTQLEQVRETPAGQRREDSGEKTEKSQAPPPLSSTLPPLSSSVPKTANAYVSTPEWLASLRGPFWVYSGKGTLVLTGDQLAFTDTQNGQHTTIPLTAIRDVSLGNYPWFSKPAALHYVSVTWEAAGQTHRRYFTPKQGWFRPVWETNPIVRDWHQALRAAVTAATGKAPAETPTPPHRPTLREGALMGLMFGMPVVLIGAAFFILKGVFASAHGGNAQPTNWLLPGLALFAAIIPFLALLFLSRRSSQTSGKSDGTPPPASRPRLPLLSVGLVSLVAGLVGFLVTLGLREEAAHAPMAAAVSVALVLKVVERLAHGAMPAVLIMLVIVFALLVPSVFWPMLRRRREANPAPASEPRSPLLGFGLALMCVPLVIYLLMLPVQLLLPEPVRRGSSFLLGFPEAIILAVLGGLGYWRWRQRPAAPATPSGRGRNLFGVGLICFGMFLGGLKIQEVSRDHVQRVHRMAAEIPPLQKQWLAAGNEVFAANTQLNRHIAQEPLARTDAERQRHAIELGRLEGEVSKAKVRQDVILGQMRTTQERLAATPFPFAEAAALVFSWSLPFVLAGLLVLAWRGSSRRENAPSSGFKHAGLLMLLMPVLLLAFLFLKFSGKAPSPFGSAPAVAITNVGHTVIGISNTVLFTELDFRVEGTEPVELRVEFTGPELPGPVASALALESPDHGRLFASLRARQHNALLLEPAPSAAQQPRVHFQPGTHKWQIGFALPTERATWQARGKFRPPVTRLAPSNDGEQAWELFTVGSDHQPPALATYTARIVATRSRLAGIVPPSAPPELLPLTAADPGWVSVSTITQHNDTNAKLTWEILASQPGTAQFRREKNYASSSLQLDPKTKLHRLAASLELTRVSTNRVRLVTKKGYSTSTEELTGNFRELAEELRRHENLSAKTVLGTPIELCRVKGQPLTVTVEAAAPRAPSRPSSSMKSSPGVLNYPLFALIALGAIVIGFGGVALLVWLLRKGGASKRVVLLVLAVPLLLAAVGLAALIGYRATGGMRFEKFERMQLHNDYQPHPGPNPPGRVGQTQNGFRLQLAVGQLATFELLLKQADDSLQPIPALTALVAAGTNAPFTDRLYWTLRRLGTENTSDYWSWSVTAHDGHGRALPQLTDHGTNFSHTLAPGDTLDWWQLNLPTSVTFGAGEEKLIPLFRTHGTATTRGAHPKEAWLRVRCAALPTGFVTNGTPRIELGLTAHALLAGGRLVPLSANLKPVPPRPGANANELTLERRITSAKPGWMWLKGGGEKAIGQQLLLDPNDGLYHGGVVIRLEKSEGHQVGPEHRARLGYGFAGMSTPWGTVTSMHEFEDAVAAFRQQVAKLDSAPLPVPTEGEFVELTRLHGAVVSVALTSNGDSAPGEVQAPAGKPASPTGKARTKEEQVEWDKTKAAALSHAMQAIRMGDFFIVAEPGKHPPGLTHDPETGYPIIVLPVGPVEVHEIYNEAMRAHYRDQKEAKKAK